VVLLYIYVDSHDGKVLEADCESREGEIVFIVDERATWRLS
jgi:hypothetical protein